MMTKFAHFLSDFFCLRKKFLVYNFVDRNLKISYRRSFLGLLWTLLVPFSMGCIYYFFFKKIANIAIPHYLPFVLSGSLLWNFFSTSILMGTESVVAHTALLSKLPIPMQVFPLITTITHFVTFLYATPVIAIALWISQVPFSWTMLLFPFYILNLCLMTYGLALLGALGFIYLRDLRQVMQILVQIWFYTTPVLFDAKMIPEKYQWILIINPVGFFFQNLHEILIYGKNPPLYQTVSVLGWTAIILSAAAFCYNKGKKMAVEML